MKSKMMDYSRDVAYVSNTNVHYAKYNARQKIISAPITHTISAHKSAYQTLFLVGNFKLCVKL